MRPYDVGVFTGIVRELGRIEALEGDDQGIRLRIGAPMTAAEARAGDSVALNGVCLTVTAVVDGSLDFDAVPETLARTSLGRLAAGYALNVEPAVRVGDPLGGHLVQGHIDGVGRVRSILPEGDGARVEIEAGPEILRYCVEKGSIAVDGVSLTIAALGRDAFTVALIPHTLAATTLGELAHDQEVNLEVDVLAKYAERLLGAYAAANESSSREAGHGEQPV